MSKSDRVKVMLTGTPTASQLATISKVFQAAGFEEIDSETHPIPKDLTMPVAEPTLEVKSTRDVFERRRPDFAIALGALRSQLPKFGLILLLAAEDTNSVFAWRRKELAGEVSGSVASLPIHSAGSFGWDSQAKSWTRT